MTDKDIFYVEIHHPVDFRRSLLEASRDLLRALQKFEDLKSVRADKMKEIAKLKSTVKDINSILNQAKNQVPALNIKLPEPPKAKEKPKEEKKPAAHAHNIKKKDIKVQYKAQRDVTDLEKQMKEIESKLGSLG
jgi:chromosome segregation ATPase